MNTCKNCKYFNTCGDIDRVTPCDGYTNRLENPALAERIFEVYDLYDVKDNDASTADVLHALTFTPDVVIKSLLDIIENLQDA